MCSDPVYPRVNAHARSILFGLPAGSYGAANVYMEHEYGISQDKFPWLFWATTSWNVGECRLHIEKRTHLRHMAQTPC